MYHSNSGYFYESFFMSNNAGPANNNSDAGLSSRVKEAFTRFVGRGVNEIKPITRQLEIFCQRKQSERFRIAPARMVDDVDTILKSLWRNDNDKNRAVDIGLPIIIMAYAPAMRPAQTSRGWPLVESISMKLSSDDPDYYNIRLAPKEWDVQIAVFSYDQESVIAIMDFLRMYFYRFRNHRWPIYWEYTGKQFNTWGMLSDGFEPEEIAVPIEGRTNIFCHAFNFPITFAIPYVGEKMPTIKAVEMQINPGGDASINSVVESESKQDWPTSC